jgi:hypothetical protein
VDEERWRRHVVGWGAESNEVQSRFDMDMLAPQCWGSRGGCGWIVGRACCGSRVEVQLIIRYKLLGHCSATRADADPGPRLLGKARIIDENKRTRTEANFNTTADLDEIYMLVSTLTSSIANEAPVDAERAFLRHRRSSQNHPIHSRATMSLGLVKAAARFSHSDAAILDRHSGRPETHGILASPPTRVTRHSPPISPSL